MILRPPNHWFIRLFAWHGSVLPDILFRLFLNLLMSLLALALLDWYETLGIKLTLAPFSLLGVSIAIFLGFRNSVCYARFSEARLLPGALLIACRNILRQVIAFCPADAERVQAMLLGQHSAANMLHLQLSQWLAKQRQIGVISDIVWSTIDNNLNQIAAVLGGCERLASMPVPFAYGLLLRRTVYLFCALLPFALAPDLHAMTPLVSMFISYTFLSLDTLAEELEMPFGYKNNHLPMDAICINIEINLREMSGEKDLPQPMQPDCHYRLS
ncbi:bestrophin family protein [Pantoea stewartii]|uniref:bestrophin family protein n=1 Tax=Pantoea stewartii TaxID=66269 RepID=UPI00345C023E